MSTSNYDENLQDNPFFKEILKNHADIIPKIIDEGWILCVPRSGSILEPITPEVILEHVLVPNQELPHTHYTSLSRRFLKIQDKMIEVDETPKVKVRVLFEETHYVENQKYKVWCLERPLGQICETADWDGYRPCDLCDCVDLLWGESFDRDVLEGIHRVTEDFFVKNESFISEELQFQRELIGGLYSRCLQNVLCDRRLLSKSLEDGNVNSNIKVSVEAYMQSCLGKKLFFSICTAVFAEDAQLNKIVQNLKEIEYEDLKMPEHLHELSFTAKCELSKINKFSTILGKVNCLRRAFLSVTNNGKISLTADDLLFIFAYIILKLDINNWFGNLTYIKDFNFSASDVSDESSFLITTLEASLRYIRDGLILNDLSTKKTNELEERIKSNDLDYIKNYLSDSENYYESKKIDLCHPLCMCKNCEKQNGESSKTPILILATNFNKLSIVEYLLTNEKQNVNVTDEFGCSSLHIAARNGLQDILLLLIDSGADVNLKNSEGNTALHLSVNNGHENCVKALIYSSLRVNLNVCNEYGNTALHLASKWGYVSIVKFLIEQGASIKIKNKSGFKPIDVSQNNHINQIFENCNQKPNKKRVQFSPTIQQKIFSTPKQPEQLKKIDLLLKAIQNNDLPLTCFYLGLPNPSQTPNNPTTCHPLCDCPKCQSTVDQPEPQTKPQDALNVNVSNADGYTPLHISSKYGRTEILRLLLDVGADVNARTIGSCYVPLHLACLHQQVPAVRELLKCGGCRVDARDARGNTPLFYACSKNDVRIFEMLLKNGADVGVKNNENVSVVQEAERKLLYNILGLVKEGKKSGFDDL